MMDKLNLLTAGIPLRTESKDYKNAFRVLEAMKLDGIELEFVHGVRMSENSQEVVKTISKEKNMIVTAHGPYYINLNSKEQEKIDASVVRIIDTAGILKPRDIVEKKAVARSKKHIDIADLVIVVFDGSKKLTKEDSLFMKKLNTRRSIAVINKMDLKQLIERKKLEKNFPKVISISAKKIKNINYGNMIGGKHQLSIDIKNLASGFYTLNLSSKANSSKFKIVKN